MHIILFLDGMVHEYVDKGTFKRFNNTTCSIYSLEIPEKNYETMKNKIESMYENKENYKFNILGLFAVSLNKKIDRENTFYCAEFVKYVLEDANIKTNLPNIITPSDFQNIENVEKIYKGYLREYKKE